MLRADTRRAPHRWGVLDPRTRARDRVSRTRALAQLAETAVAQTLLLVDDDAFTARMVAAMVKEFGFEVVIARDGGEAITKLKAGRPPALMLLDLMMPGIGGFSLLDALESVGLSDTFPVVVLSGTNSTEDVVRAEQLGAADLVIKPFDPRDLITRIQDLTRPFDEAAFRHVLERLRILDNSVLSAPGLATYRTHTDAYLTQEDGREALFLMPRGTTPQAISKKPLGDIASRIVVLRKRSGGWRRVWPVPTPKVLRDRLNGKS